MAKASEKELEFNAKLGVVSRLGRELLTDWVKKEKPEKVAEMILDTLVQDGGGLRFMARLFHHGGFEV